MDAQRHGLVQVGNSSCQRGVGLPRTPKGLTKNGELTLNGRAKQFVRQLVVQGLAG
jgi:hypothetical protein